MTWLLTALVAGAVVWIWWQGRHPLPSDKESPATRRVVPAPAKSRSTRPVPDAPPFQSERDDALRQVPVQSIPQPAQPPTAVTWSPPASVTLTTRTVVRVGAPSNAPSTLPAPTAASTADDEARFQALLAAQVALARLGLSPGSIDGKLGGQTRAAFRAFQEREGLPVTGEADSNTLTRLALPVDALRRCAVTAEDVGQLRPMGRTWLAKSEQDRLDYETVLELMAERFASHPKLIERLNPGLDPRRLGVGTTLTVPNVEPPAVLAKAAFVKIFLGRRVLQAFNADNLLLAHFPCSIAQKVEKRPAGETLRVQVVIHGPNYTFNPAVFPESPEAQSIGRKLILQPGPNNPVGTIWIGLDKSGYGIHGTPKPEEVGRTESHGCFRLANWNAEYLAQIVSVGMPVLVEP